MITSNENTKINFKSLLRLGWNTHFQIHFDKTDFGKAYPARVVGVYKNSFLIHQGDKEELATLAGRVNYKKENRFPVIGDWIVAADSVIFDILPRENALSRSAAGGHGKQEITSIKEQVIAANLSSVFIVTGTDRDFNIRRIERYLTLVYNCGLSPVIILTKADLHQDPDSFSRQVEDIAFGVPVYLVSADDATGLIPLKSYITAGQTITMIGSSGAGKSTLVNRLYGQKVQTTNIVSEHVGKGKHTTTTRSLILMPQGGMVIDNPGIREIGFWDDGGGLDAAFPEIEALAGTCRFQNCTHSHEPGCQVIHSIVTGVVRQDRLDSYQKMKREIEYLSERQHKSADRIEKERWKEVSLKIKAIKNRR